MRIALLQLEIETGRRSANLSRINAWIDQACDADPAPDLLVLPECCDLGVAPVDVGELADPVGGAFAESLAAKAREMGVCLVAGVTERGVGGAHSAAVLFDADGDVLLRQRRIHLSEPWCGAYHAGNRLEVRNALGTTVGLGLSDDAKLICLPQALAAMGAGLMLLPSCVAAPTSDTIAVRRDWLSTLSNAAKLSSMVLLSASAVGRVDDGPARGMGLVGVSAALGPDGTVWARSDDDEPAVMLVDIPLTASADVAAE